MVSRSQFDADYAAQIAAENAYIQAVNAYVALTVAPDFSAEDAEAQAALTALKNAQAAVPQAAAESSSPSSSRAAATRSSSSRAGSTT